MTPEISVLVVTAASIGFIHTVLGPDHYLPFVALSKSRKWSLGKTLGITTVCGIGHVLSSVVIGFIGIGIGTALSRIEFIEGFRGNIAGWLLLGFGLAYLAWGIRRGILDKPHTHLHPHADGREHAHEHGHASTHAHSHRRGEKAFWGLFIIFVLGPCEPLIPLLMYPSAKGSLSGTILVAAVFAAVTVATMLAVTLTLILGLGKIKLKRLERFSHALAGGVIACSGLAIVVGL